MTIRTKRGFPIAAFGGDFDKGARHAASTKAVMQSQTVTQQRKAEFCVVASSPQLLRQKEGIGEQEIEDRISERPGY